MRFATVQSDAAAQFSNRRDAGKLSSTHIEINFYQLSGITPQISVVCPVMLATLLSLALLTNGAALITELQTTPPAPTQNAAAILSPAEISDLQKKADAGDPAAQYALGKAYESANGVPHRTDQAAIWYRKSADQGNEKAQNALAVLYWLGDGVERNKTEAVRWYRKAARQGNANAMFNLGAAYYNGEGVNTDDTLAFAWFLLSAAAGNSSGQDAAQRSATEHGRGSYSDACIAIGQMYEKGDELPKNTDSAIAWYRKAVDRGSVQAKLGLASVYLNTSDYQQARHLCESAAKEKISGGYFCLGYLFQKGYGVAPDPKKAFNWYDLAARDGNATAMLTLAGMYEKGEGTKPDRAEAFVWFFLASRRGQPEAAAEARRIRSSMTAKEWKDAQKKLPFDPKAIDKSLEDSGTPRTP